MSCRARTPFLVALLALALLVPASASAAAERTVSVTASATLKVPNDSAGLGLSVSVERRSRGAALRAGAPAMACQRLACASVYFFLSSDRSPSLASQQCGRFRRTVNELGVLWLLGLGGCADVAQSY